jgi:YD repeat-containing protein
VITLSGRTEAQLPTDSINYAYDDICNMTQGKSEGGKTVTWNVYNKITAVALSAGKSLAFGYDAGGNRIRKESTVSSVTIKQWYVRDAQGNIISVYKRVGSGTVKYQKYLDLAIMN